MPNEVAIVIATCLAGVIGLIAKWVVSTAKLTAKVATDSIARSEEREKDMVADMKESKLYIQDTLVALVKGNQEALVNSTNALRENSLIHQSTKVTLRELIKATEKQTAVIEATAREVKEDSKLGMGRPPKNPADHGGNIH